MFDCARPQLCVSPRGNCHLHPNRSHSLAVLIVMVASLLTLTDAVQTSREKCISGVCLHGGTRTDSGTCACPVKYSGACCEHTEHVTRSSSITLSSGRSVVMVPTCAECYNGGTRYYSNIHAVHKCLCPPYHDGICCEVEEGSSNSHAQMYLWVSVAASGIVLLLVCLCVLCFCKRLD